MCVKGNRCGCSPGRSPRRGRGGGRLPSPAGFWVFVVLLVLAGGGYMVEAANVLAVAAVAVAVGVAGGLVWRVRSLTRPAERPRVAGSHQEPLTARRVPQVGPARVWPSAVPVEPPSTRVIAVTVSKTQVER